MKRENADNSDQVKENLSSFILEIPDDTPRNFSLVKFVLAEGYEKEYPFKVGRWYLFMGEIPNMPGHCVVMDYQPSHLPTCLLSDSSKSTRCSCNVSGPQKMYVGYSVDNFEEIPEDEL